MYDPDRIERIKREIEEAKQEVESLDKRMRDDLVGCTVLVFLITSLTLVALLLHSISGGF